MESVDIWHKHQRKNYIASIIGKYCYAKDRPVYNLKEVFISERCVTVVFKIKAFPKPVSLQRGCQISNVIFLTLSLNVYSNKIK
jgi:hypothetical protein